MLTTNESVENYLETILVLSQKLPVVRSVDVANETGYKKSSVSVAMKNLREMCYIEVSDSGYITLTAAGKKIADKDGLIPLTASGMAIAERMLDRHHTLTKFLMALGIDAATAETDACKIEHVISQETFEAIKRHVNSTNA